jgi:TM2 domain-containing membrane protein YozV
MSMLEKYQLGLTKEQKLYLQSEYDKQAKSPTTALVLCLFLGGLGAHRFYLRQNGLGVAYVLFCWSFIPLVVSLIECFVIQSRTKEYNEKVEKDVLKNMDIVFGSSFGSSEILQQILQQHS